MRKRKMSDASTPGNNEFSEALYMHAPLAWRGYEIERLFEGMGERKDWAKHALDDTARTLRLPEDDLKVAAIWFRLQRRHKESNLPWHEPERDRNRPDAPHHYWTLFYFAFLDSLRFSFNPYFRDKSWGARLDDPEFRHKIASEVICQLIGSHGTKSAVSRQGDNEGYRKIAEHAKQDEWLGEVPSSPETVLALAFQANGWAAFRAEYNDNGEKIADTAAETLHKVVMEGLSSDFRYSSDEYERRALFFMLAQRLYVTRDVAEDSRERALFAALYLDFYRRPLGNVFMRKSFLKMWREIPFEEKESFAVACRKLLVKTRNEALSGEKGIEALLSAVPDEAIKGAVDFINSLPTPEAIAASGESGAEGCPKSVHEPEPDATSLQIIEGARLYAKQAVRERFQVLEQSPFGQGAKCLFIKQIKTQHDFADFIFYWGKLAFAVLTDAIWKGKSLLSEERRRVFLSVCERNRIHPLLFRVLAEDGPGGAGPDGTNFLEIVYSADGVEGWGFVDYSCGIETDAGVLLATPQPEGDVPMSELEIQTIACSHVRIHLANLGCKIECGNNWPGVLGSIVFRTPEGVLSWAHVEGVTEPHDEPDFKEILSKPECAQYAKMLGLYAQVGIGNGFRDTAIATKFHAYHPIGIS